MTAAAFPLFVLLVPLHAVAMDDVDSALRERLDQESTRHSVEVLAVAAKSPGAPERTRLALLRARYFFASWHVTGPDQSRAFAQNVADGLAFLAEQMGESFQTFDGLSEKLESVPKKSVGYLYWTAVSYGRTVEQVSLVKRWGAARRFRAAVERVLVLDDTYFYGGAHRALAAFLSRAPRLVGGNSNRALEHARQALAIEPRYAGNRLALAEVLNRQSDERAESTRELGRALELPDDAIPDCVPEQVAAKGYARKLMNKESAR